MQITDREMLEEIEDGSGDWEVIEDGDWVQDYKYQIRTSVVLHVPTGKYYQYEMSRSGSPFTDWYYSYEDGGELPELFEVVKATRTITEEYWKGV